MRQRRFGLARAPPEGRCNSIPAATFQRPRPNVPSSPLGLRLGPAPFNARLGVRVKLRQQGRNLPVQSMRCQGHAVGPQARPLADPGLLEPKHRSETSVYAILGWHGGGGDGGESDRGLRSVRDLSRFGAPLSPGSSAAVDMTYCRRLWSRMRLGAANATKGIHRWGGSSSPSRSGRCAASM